jgi:hypothetical protein
MTSVAEVSIQCPIYTYPINKLSYVHIFCPNYLAGLWLFETRL